jgi:hypothetical protein
MSEPASTDRSIEHASDLLIAFLVLLDRRFDEGAAFPSNVMGKALCMPEGTIARCWRNAGSSSMTSYALTG